MSLPVMSLFWFSRKGRTGRGEWVHPKGTDNLWAQL